MPHLHDSFLCPKASATPMASTKPRASTTPKASNTLMRQPHRGVKPSTTLRRQPHRSRHIYTDVLAVVSGSIHWCLHIYQRSSTGVDRSSTRSKTRLIDGALAPAPPPHHGLRTGKSRTAPGQHLVLHAVGVYLSVCVCLYVHVDKMESGDSEQHAR